MSRESEEFIESKNIFAYAMVADGNAPENHFMLSELLNEYAQSKTMNDEDKKKNILTILRSYQEEMKTGCDGDYQNEMAVSSEFFDIIVGEIVKSIKL